MQRALELAVRARGRTSPNPMVGAVIVKNGSIVGEGYHQQAGSPHAEVNAIQAAGPNAYEASMYVNLEPCCHFGRTPPCTEALIRAGLEKVYIAVKDPNPLVAGQGIKMLEAAGVIVNVGLMEQEAGILNEVYFKYIQKKIPFVTLKTAMSIDGKIAAYTGDSKWVTGESSRLLVHQLRNTYDAVMVGIGTVIADDPMLNTRLESTAARDPIRIIIDGALEIPLTSQIVRSASRQTTYVICARNQNPSLRHELVKLGVKILEIGSDPAAIPLKEALRQLGELKITSILLEGGAFLNAAMLENKLINKVIWFIAPKIVGGARALTPVGGQGAAAMDEAIVLERVHMEPMGEDIMLIGYTGW